MDSNRQFDLDSVVLLRDALSAVEQGFEALPPNPSVASGTQGLPEVLRTVAERLRDNFPYFHPLYAGQMLKPPHPVARLAAALAMWINPNNHALDGGRATSAMEKEAVGEIARMFGWPQHLGHLTSGGTVANLEALWIAGQLHPGGIILASEQAHYTHERISGVLKLNFESVACDSRGRMDLEALERRLQAGGVGTVVATVGSTAAGAVDPLPALIELRRQYQFHLHADAAYGGYFVLAENLDAATREALIQLRAADSIVVDPHKHGLQPYGCGCVLFADPAVGRFYKHNSPYTYFSSNELHLGEISLECSRPGAAAAGLWATQKLLPLVRRGDFARGLEKGRAAALALHQRLREDARFVAGFTPELDIVLWVPRARRVSDASKRAQQVFDEAAKRGLHLALATVPVRFFDFPGSGTECDAQMVRCLRSVLMKPEHLDWIDRIWAILDDATRAAMGTGADD